MFRDCLSAKDQLHEWLYDNIVYKPPICFSPDCISVHRQCSLCGIHEVSVTKDWLRSYGGLQLPDLRN